MERTIFDEGYIEKLQNDFHYRPIEQAYESILKGILERVSRFEAIKNINFHIIVTNGIYLRNDSDYKDTYIILEWPLIGFIDLINKSVLCAKDFDEYYVDCKAIVNAYIEKYIHGVDINLFTQLYEIENYNPIQYQIIQIFHQIQSIFLLGHELGHLLYPEYLGLEAEKKADLEALETVREYMQKDRRVTVWIIIAIMLLYAYLMLLDVGLAKEYKEKIQRRESWLDRYDMILDQFQTYTLSTEERKFVDSYDVLCSKIDELCIEIIESKV